MASASQAKQSFHHPDGPEQESRDKAIREASSGEGKNPDTWGDKAFQTWIWGVDIQQQAVDRFETIFNEVSFGIGSLIVTLVDHTHVIGEEAGSTSIQNIASVSQCRALTLER